MFFKYFFICSAVILISFICLGAVLLLVSSRYFTGEKRDRLISDLTKASAEIRSQTADDMKGEGTEGEPFNRKVSDILKYYAGADNSTLMLFDSEGKLLLTSNDAAIEGFDNTRSLTPEALESFDTEPDCFESDMDGYFAEKRHTAVVKFTLGGTETVYMINSASVSSQDTSVVNMLWLYLTSAVVVLVMTVIIIYITTARLTSPVKEIASAAQKIGGGDFSVKLPEYEITEFNEIGEALNEMAVSLNNYDRARGNFVANVSHELRTPMTSIGGFVDGIIDGTIPPSQQKKYLALVSDEIKRLTRMVKSMLNLAKIESGSTKLELKPVSIIEVIATTLFSFEQRINEKHIDIRGLDVDRVMVSADEDLIHQVMYNLIENAIKFVDTGGYIAFEFSPGEEETLISIINSGEGLKEDELSMVFDRFYKTDASRGLDATGVGLGLNIVRSIIDLHGGRIRVTSVEGEYTKFIISLKSAPRGSEHSRQVIS